MGEIYFYHDHDLLLASEKKFRSGAQVIPREITLHIPYELISNVTEST